MLRRNAESDTSSFPSNVVDALKAQLVGLPMEALKACLPQIQESIQQTVLQSMEAHLPLFATQCSRQRWEISQIHKGMKVVSDELASVQSLIDTNSKPVTDLRQAFHDINFLFESAEVFKKANAEGEK
ncbi:hypothetical protein Tco_0022528 [Tanacetum coccineum]